MADPLVLEIEIRASGPMAVAILRALGHLSPPQGTIVVPMGPVSEQAPRPTGTS